MSKPPGFVDSPPIMSKDFQRLPGFRDFPPEDLAVRAHVFDAWRRVSRRYGFMEYDGPPLEPLELYVEKSGQEIVGQLYSFRDKGDRDVSLRPEMIAATADVVAAGPPLPLHGPLLPRRRYFGWGSALVQS